MYIFTYIYCKISQTNIVIWVSTNEYWQISECLNTGYKSPNIILQKKTTTHIYINNVIQ